MDRARDPQLIGGPTVPKEPTVLLRHPDTGGEYRATPEAVPGWEALGWQRADKAGKPSKTKSEG